MLRVVAALAVLLHVGSAKRFGGRAWFDVGVNGGISGGSEMTADVSEDAVAGLVVDFDQNVKQPVTARSVWLEFKKTFSDVATVAKGTVDLRGPSREADVEVEFTKPFNNAEGSFGALFNSRASGFLTRVRAACKFSALEDKRSLVTTTYNVPEKSTEVAFRQEVPALSDADAEVTWKQDGNEVLLKFIQRVPDWKAAFSPSYNTKSGEFECTVDKELRETGGVSMTFSKSEPFSFKWTDFSNGGEWQTSGTLSKNVDKATVSLRREWSF